MYGSSFVDRGIEVHLGGFIDYHFNNNSAIRENPFQMEARPLKAVQACGTLQSAVSCQLNPPRAGPEQLPAGEYPPLKPAPFSGRLISIGCGEIPT